MARIQASEADYGDSYPAWAALVAARLEHDQDPRAARATALLAIVARSAAETDAFISQLRRLVLETEVTA